MKRRLKKVHFDGECLKSLGTSKTKKLTKYITVNDYHPVALSYLRRFHGAPDGRMLWLDGVGIPLESRLTPSPAYIGGEFGASRSGPVSQFILINLVPGIKLPSHQ